MALELVYSRRTFAAEPYLDIRPSPQPWLVKGVLPTRGVSFLVGASKAGKSFLAIDTALRIASGAKVLGRTTRRCGVVYLGAEDADGCRSRISAWRRKHRPDNDMPFDFYGYDINLLNAEMVEDWCDSIEESIARFDTMNLPLGVIIIDTLSQCIPGVDENSSTGMSQAFIALKQIGLRFRCLVLVLAHFGKSGEERGIRGWSGMDSNSDATITLERDKEDPDLRTLTLAKVKNGIDGKQVSFRLDETEVGILDEDGEEVYSCLVTFEKTPPEKTRVKRKAMNPPQTLIFQALKYLTDNGKPQPIPSDIQGVKPWHKGIYRGDLALYLMGTSFAFEGESADATRMRQNRALQGLEAQGRIRTNGDLFWLV